MSPAQSSSLQTGQILHTLPNTILSSVPQLPRLLSPYWQVLHSLPTPAASFITIPSHSYPSPPWPPPAIKPLSLHTVTPTPTTLRVSAGKRTLKSLSHLWSLCQRLPTPFPSCRHPTSSLEGHPRSCRTKRADSSCLQRLPDFSVVSSQCTPVLTYPPADNEASPTCEHTT